MCTIVQMICVRLYGKRIVFAREKVYVFIFCFEYFWIDYVFDLEIQIIICYDSFFYKFFVSFNIFIFSKFFYFSLINLP